MFTPVNEDCLNLVFSHLNEIDLVSAAYVSFTWRAAALHRLSLVRRLECDTVRRAFANRGTRRCQSHFEEIIRYCGKSLVTIDLRSISGRDVFHDFVRLITIITRYCPKIEELFIPQNSLLRERTVFPSTLKRVELRGHVAEEALQSLAQSCPNLDTLTLDINMFTTGEFFPKHLAKNQMKKIELNRCCNISSNTIHFILKNYARSLESLSLSGFPSEILYFDKSDLVTLEKLQFLDVSRDNFRDNFRFYNVHRLIELTPNLKHLTLQNCSDLHADPGNLAALARSCPGLETLDLTGCTLPSAVHLIPLTSLTQLKKLILNRVKIAGPPFPGEPHPLPPPQGLHPLPPPQGLPPLPPPPGENIPVSIDYDLLLNSVLLKLSNLNHLHLADTTATSLTDKHIYKLLSGSNKLEKLDVSMGCGIDGSFIEKCTDLEREVYVSVATKKGCSNGDTLYGRTLCPPNFLTVYVSWDD